MLSQVILLLVHLITFHSFSFSLISFLIIICSYKKNAEVYDYSRFNKNSFLDEFNKTNWNSVMEIDKTGVNKPFNNYLPKVNYLIM